MKSTKRNALVFTSLYPAGSCCALAIALLLPTLAQAQSNGPVTGSMVQETPEQRVRIDQSIKEAEAQRQAAAAAQARQEAAARAQEQARLEAEARAQQQARQDALARAQQLQAQRDAQVRAQQQAQLAQEQAAQQRAAAGSNAGNPSSIVRQLPSPYAAQNRLVSTPPANNARMEQPVATVTTPAVEVRPVPPQQTSVPAGVSASPVQVQTPVSTSPLSSSSWNKPLNVGDVSRTVLQMQAEGQYAGPAVPTLGATANATWTRYVNSFSSPIPDFYETTSQPKSSQ